MKVVEMYGEDSWSRISKLMGKSQIKCHKRFLQLSNKSHLVSIPWTKSEDILLSTIVHKHGAKNWTQLAKNFPNRIAKQCRERWHSVLNLQFVKKKWTFDEDILILKLVQLKGTRWSEIAKCFPGRTDSQIKNRFNSNLKKRLTDKRLVSYLARISEHAFMAKV